MSYLPTTGQILPIATQGTEVDGFRIEIGAARLGPEGIDSGDRLELTDAIEQIFEFDRNMCLLVWNFIYIPVSYRYDVCLIVPDALGMAARLRSVRPEPFWIDWPSNTFSARWDFKPLGTMVEITTQWHTVIGGLEPLLNDRNTLRVEIDRFLAEWQLLFDVVAERLEAAGGTAETVRGIHQLRSVDR